MEIRVAVVYDGGRAHAGLLSAYDAGISIAGFARAFAITGHALGYGGVPRVRAAKIPGIEVYVTPPQAGSFIQELRVVLSDPVVAFGAGLGANVVSSAIWDLVKWSWSATVAKVSEPETDYLKDLFARQEPYLGQLPAALESPLRQAHRPIEGDPDVEISVRNADDAEQLEIVKFDSETLEYISSKARDDEPVNVHGNVTRYNILSGVGRFYSQEEGRTIPFRLSPALPAIQKPFITWSLDERNRGREGVLTMRVIRFVNGRGHTKRYQVEAVQN
ncbi:MAG: hypothetical protein QOD26_1025 [Betaproteobacteria bacterium]|jgi:hypothetical protein|nr:hypothetical protein [Betaproteobacteria bacterium]